MIVDRGVYQIYGPHDVYGKDSYTLLYIGKASDQSFNTRIRQHKWLFDEDNMNGTGDLRIYLGRLGGKTDVSKQEWAASIDTAERLLIYYASPLYNTAGHEYTSVQNISKTVVVSLGKKNALPIEISTLPDESNAWIDEYKLGENDVWKFYRGTGKG